MDPVILQSLVFDWMGRHSAYHIVVEGMIERCTRFEVKAFVAGDEHITDSGENGSGEESDESSTSAVSEGGRPTFLRRAMARSRSTACRIGRKARRLTQIVGAPKSGASGGGEFETQYRFAIPNQKAIEQTIEIELEMIKLLEELNGGLVHTLYGESQTERFMRSDIRKKCTWIGGIHQPPSWWRMFHCRPEMLGEFDVIVALGNKLGEFVGSYIDPGRVHVLPLPADSKFFFPADDFDNGERLNRPRILFSGKWLRDIEVMSRSVQVLLERHPEYEFDFLVQDGERLRPEFMHLGRSERVHWHSGLSDLEMRSLVQRASVLFMPFIDAVGNCAIVEALSCGVPVVSTDVGDVGDYVKSGWGYLAECGSVEDHISGVESILKDEETHRNASRAARKFVEEELAVEHVCDQLIEIYEKYSS